MQHKRVRCDNFLSDTSLVRVTGRGGYEQSTDVWIERDATVKLNALPAARVDEHDIGWHLLDDANYDTDTYDQINGVGEINFTRPNQQT